MKGITVTHGHSSSTNMTTIKAGTTTTTAFSIEQDTTGDLVFQAGSNTPLTIANTGQVSIANTAAFKVPVGGLNDRPATPANGMLRYNSDFEEFEGYSNSKWNLLTLGSMKLKLDFDQTTTLPTGISFTRATNGTFFNSSGVLTTAGSGVARFDHRLEGTTWVNKGLLIEEQRTNLALRSEEFNDAYWTKVNVGITTNSIASPTGGVSAETLADNSTNAQHNIQSSSITITSGATITASCFLKKNPSNTAWDNVWIQVNNTGFTSGFRCRANISNGTFAAGTQTFGVGVFISQSVQDVGNDWYRFTVTGSLGTNTAALLTFFLNDGNTYVGSGNSCYAWGAQLEAGAFLTSYIATTASAVTRNQDVVNMTSTNFSSWFNSSEGTVFCRWDNIGFNVVNNYIWQIDDTTSNERYYLITTSTAAFNDAIDGNTNQTTGLSLTYNPQLFQQYSNSFAYKINDFAASFNGATVNTDTSGSLPTVTRLVLGEAQTTATRPLNGHIAKFYYWNTRKPNEFLQRVTE